MYLFVCWGVAGSIDGDYGVILNDVRVVVMQEISVKISN